MTSAVKHTSFDEYQNTLSVILKEIDDSLMQIKNRQKNFPVWKDYKNYQDFIREVERTALKRAAKELGIGDTTIRDRWHVLTLPTPVYNALESGDISFSKAKFMTAIHFDFENDNDVAVAEEIVVEIKGGLNNPQIKDLVEKKSAQVWNKKDIVVQRLVEQHGMTEESKW